jgi:hypothetical protein
MKSKGTRNYNQVLVETYSKERRKIYQDYLEAARASFKHRKILEHLEDSSQREISDEVLDNVVKS